MAADVVVIDELRVRDVLHRFQHAAFARRMQLVVAIRKHHHARLDRTRRRREVTFEAGRVADIVALYRPTAVNPVARLHIVADSLGLRRMKRMHLVARGERLLEACGGPADHRLYLQPDADAGARRIVVGVIAVLPFGIEHDRLAYRLPDEIALPVGARHWRLRKHRVHEIGKTHRPLHSLDAAHRAARHRHQLFDAEALGEHAMLGAHHVADVKARELHVKARARRRRGRVRIVGRRAQRVGLNHEILAGVECAARPRPYRLRIAIALQSVNGKNRVALVGVQRAEGDVGHFEIADDVAAFQLEIAELAGL